MNQTWENDKKPGFGPILPFWPKFGPEKSFWEFYLYQMLDIVGSDRCMQFYEPNLRKWQKT